MESVAKMLYEKNETNPELKLSAKPEVIFNTRAPIIVAQFEKESLRIDLQFPGPNLQSLRNTNLVKHYVMVSTLI